MRHDGIIQHRALIKESAIEMKNNKLKGQVVGCAPFSQGRSWREIISGWLNKQTKKLIKKKLETNINIMLMSYLNQFTQQNLKSLTLKCTLIKFIYNQLICSLLSPALTMMYKYFLNFGYYLFRKQYIKDDLIIV